MNNPLCNMPDLSFMTTEELVQMLKDCSSLLEDKWFCEGIAKEIAKRKPTNETP